MWTHSQEEKELIFLIMKMFEKDQDLIYMLSFPSLIDPGSGKWRMENGWWKIFSPSIRDTITHKRRYLT